MDAVIARKDRRPGRRYDEESEGKQSQEMRANVGQEDGMDESKKSVDCGLVRLRDESRVSRSSPGTGPGPVVGPGLDCLRTGLVVGSQRFGPPIGPGPAMLLTSVDR